MKIINYCGIILLGMLLAMCESSSHSSSNDANKGTRPNILLAISDDQSWCHAGAYGDKIIKTPAFDKIAKNGVLFNHAYCASPSCTPSRAGILTGQDIWRLEEGAQLFGTLPSKFKTYTEILERSGYNVGFMKKGWGPGSVEQSGRSHNPAGPKSYENFDEFISSVPPGTPWCFWYGSYDPHRTYEKGFGERSGINADIINVPEFMPNVPEVRSDIADYYYEIQRFDNEFGEILFTIEKQNETENTLIVVTSDNGMPFPRAKATLYDYGVRMPLAISWKNHFPSNRVVDDFVSLTDLAPTFLKVAKVSIPAEMTGKSLLPLLESNNSGLIDPNRDFILTGKERHAWCRQEGVGYGSRMLRTKNYLYVRNYYADRWPAGDSSIVTNEGSYGDIDASPSKSFIINHKDDPEYSKYFDLSIGKRSKEELYNCLADPFQMNNIAELTEFQEIKNELSQKLTSYLQYTNDPRETNQDVKWDELPYYGRHDWETNPGR
ncbi:sulfatase family protein [Sunxiuqinia sp. A32]|uniref:sulfatase family protein n=1 Tax=Sunxiuqinia sp. A32 TaxID=3461496 RepID=UPI0040453C26